MKAAVCVYLTLCFAAATFHPTNFESVNKVSGQQNGSEAALHASIGDTVCMQDLGCFTITKDFYHLRYRPLNLLPRDRVTIGTRFLLYTKDHPKEWTLLDARDPEGIKESPFEPKHRTKFIVHGFWDSTWYGKWMEILKDNFLLSGNYNVIIVDWSKGNGAPYTQATANTRVVGAEIAFLIESLEKIKGISPMDCHIVGHSLGSHIAGYAGEKLHQLGRISAVDPAQPYFQNMPPSVRIDPTDADFVDVIHTDSSSSKFLALGMDQPVGHVDFYPNNGKSQPGCGTESIQSIFLEGLIDATRRFVACNHQRAVDYFTYSLNYKRTAPVGYACAKWDDYLDGQCAECGPYGERCAIMGIRADEYRPFKNDSQPLKVYLATSDKAPYWLYSYQISLKLYKPKRSFKDRKGNLFLRMLGVKSNMKAKLTKKITDLVHGATYRFLIGSKEDLGDIKNVTFWWECSSWSFFQTPVLYLEYIKVVPMNIINKKKKKTQTRFFCSKSENEIKENQEIKLNSHCNHIVKL